MVSSIDYSGAVHVFLELHKMAVEYERLLSRQLGEIEQELTNQIILLQTRINIEKTKGQSVNAERSTLQNNVKSIAKELKDIQVLPAENGTESEANSELTTVNADANLLNQILTKVLEKLKNKEKKLCLHLEEIQTTVATYYNGKQAKSEYEKQTILGRKAKKEVAELTNLKWLQDAYFHRLKVDIAFSELSLNEMAVLLQKERQSGSQFPLSTKKLNGAIQLFTKCALSLDRWHSCINFSMEELFLNDAVSPILKFSTSGLDEAKVVFLLFRACNFLEAAVKVIEEKTQLMKQVLQSQEEFNFALHHRLVASRLRAISLNSHMMSHSDPVQTRGFKAELNLEIRQFICDKLNRLEDYTSISVPRPSNDSDSSNLTSVNLKLFGDEPYLAELLASCVKLRKKNVELTRRSAALTFRKSRLNVEKLNISKLFYTLTNDRKTLEKDAYKLNTQVAFLSAAEESKNFPLLNKNASEQTRRLELEDTISGVQFEMQNIQNTLNCLNVEHDEILQKCEYWSKRISAVEDIRPTVTATRTFTTQQISLALDVQHSLVQQKYELQKQLEHIVLRRNCSLNSFAISFNQVDVCQQPSDSGLSMDDLELEVSALGQHVNELRTRLLKQTTVASGASQLAILPTTKCLNQN